MRRLVSQNPVVVKIADASQMFSRIIEVPQNLARVVAVSFAALNEPA